MSSYRRDSFDGLVIYHRFVDHRSQLLDLPIILGLWQLCLDDLIVQRWQVPPKPLRHHPQLRITFNEVDVVLTSYLCVLLQSSRFILCKRWHYWGPKPCDGRSRTSILLWPLGLEDELIELLRVRLLAENLLGHNGWI